MRSIPIDLNQPASRAFGPTMPPAVPGGPAPKLDFDTHVLVHAANPDRPQTEADLLALAKAATN